MHRSGPGRGVSNASPCMQKPQNQEEPSHGSCHRRPMALFASCFWRASLNREATRSCSCSPGKVCPLKRPLVCSEGDWEEGRQELVWAESLGEKAGSRSLGVHISLARPEDFLQLLGRLSAESTPWSALSGSKFSKKELHCQGRSPPHPQDAQIH